VHYACGPPSTGAAKEGEIQLILEAAVKPKGRVKLGSLLAQIGRECDGVDLTLERDRPVTEPRETDN
jgi:antitoxin FitA